MLELKTSFLKLGIKGFPDIDYNMRSRQSFQVQMECSLVLKIIQCYGEIFVESMSDLFH